MNKPISVQQGFLFFMKVSLIHLVIVFVSVVMAHAVDSLGQEVLNTKVSIEVKNTTVSEVLSILEKKADVKFTYSPKLLRSFKKVDLQFEDSKLIDVLAYVFNTEVSFKVIGKQIALKPMGKSAQTQLEGFTALPIASIAVSGKVTDPAGTPIPGVSILVKGTTIGTTTNSNGDFSLEVPGKESVLVVSFIGFARQEITVGEMTTINVALAEDITQLNEVVVTALGIEKETRTLGYAVTEVSGETLTKAREINVVNSLVGRVAGVNVSGVNGGPGSSSNIIIRGVSSITGDSQPLYVINGVPIDNGTRGSAGMWGGADFGDGISNINPDDIESITVLKGATASALYGARASNGVIVITTKGGKNQKGIGVEYNMNLTVDRVNDLTDFQYEYGQGADGQKPSNLVAALYTNSWGARLDGSNVIQLDNVERPYVAQKENIKNFYRTGHSVTNTLSFYGGNEKTRYRFSASDLNNKSIVPSSGLKRNTFNLNLNFDATSKLKVDLVSNFVIDKSDGRPNLSDAPGNANFGVSFLPTNVDVNILKPGYDENGNETFYKDDYSTNPWFAAEKFINDLSRNRLINIVSARYNFTNWLTLQGRVGNDLFFDKNLSITPSGTGFLPDGNLFMDRRSSSETNADFLLTANKNISTDFATVISVGGNLRKKTTEWQFGGGDTFGVPFLYTIQNLTNQYPGISETRKLEVQSFYYTAEFSYKNLMFLTTTGRNDKFSSLDGRSIFYPSVGASFVFSELIKSSILNFGKIRASWASTTGNTDQFAYSTKLYYSLDGTINGRPIGSITNASVPNKDLEPYSVDEFEFGTELKFFDNRLGLDIAYYNRQTTNEIFDVTLSPSTGYLGSILNLGSLENRGVELLLTGTPFKSNNFSWNISFNYTKNKNKVVKLSEEIESVEAGQSRTQNAFIQHKVDLPVSQVMAFDYARDASGRIIHDAQGFPIQGELKAYGSGYHSTFGGVNNEFIFKNLSVSFLIDFKLDGKIFSATDYYAYLYGKHKNTLPGREEGITGQGVDESGDPNTTTATAAGYYNVSADRISSLFVYDASFVKFRQLIIGYSLPSKWFGKFPVKGVTFSLVGRNLAILKKSTPNVDPESNYNNSKAQGLEMSGVPSMRSYGFNLNIKF